MDNEQATGSEGAFSEDPKENLRLEFARRVRANECEGVRRQRSAVQLRTLRGSRSLEDRRLTRRHGHRGRGGGNGR